MVLWKYRMSLPAAQLLNRRLAAVESAFLHIDAAAASQRHSRIAAAESAILNILCAWTPSLRWSTLRKAVDGVCLDTVAFGTGA
jgi:hypothetical protein